MLSGRGRAYYELGQYQLAVQSLDQAIRLNPNLLVASDVRAYYWRGLSPYQLAIQDLEQVILVDSTNANVHAWMGNVYYRLEQRPQGDAAWDRACRLDSQYC